MGLKFSFLEGTVESWGRGRGVGEVIFYLRKIDVTNKFSGPFIKAFIKPNVFNIRVKLLEYACFSIVFTILRFHILYGPFIQSLLIGAK